MMTIEFRKRSDFMSAHGEAACQAAKFLDVVVQQDKGQPMIGLPVHSFADNVAKLVGNDFKVSTHH